MYSKNECERLGIRPDYPKPHTLPQWRDFLRDASCDTPEGEAWSNGRYDCVVAPETFTLPDGRTVEGKRIHVCNFDQSARHDWRDFQRIKNALAGEDWEAVELYPAEARLRDPSNAFYLWCFPPGCLDWFGSVGRLVCGPEKALAPQRRIEP